MILRKEGAAFTVMTPAMPIEASGVVHPWQITTLWSDAELEAIGLYRVDPPALPGAGVWTEDGDGKPVWSYDDLAAALTAYAAQKRWECEVAGITVTLGGVEVAIATDDRSKTMISGARIAANVDANFTTPWVCADGSIHTLTAAEIVTVSDAVLAHVAGCFSTYATVKAAIDAATITDAAGVDAAFAA